MDRKSKEPNDHKYTITGIFHGFSNSTFNQVYLDHSSNNSYDPKSNWIPAILNVDIQDEQLKNRLKSLPKKTKIEVVIERSTDARGICAHLLSFKEVGN